MIKVAIVGYGNIGKAVYEAVSQSEDMKLVVIVSSKKNIAGAPVVDSIHALGAVDVAIICSPSRTVPGIASDLLARGISTVDSYDIHSSIVNVRARLDVIAKENGSVAITAAGWDPGSDSVIRTLFSAMIPKGITYTNFGPGMSMGHTVAVKAIPGVKDALSMTIPAGTGIHRRMVYIELEPGADFAEVADAIKQDDYFVHDETHVFQVDSVNSLKDMGHGVNLVRKGVSGTTHNQRVEFNMSINNPALTGQILVSAARAASKQEPGCYTMIEIAPIDFLPGNPEQLIRQLV
ncbi:MAG: diaminopimelate dehydrogenase [Clostridiales bacterium]|nr:diaminopimelate dehydrogenase [Clostridiales bacterium]